MQYISHIKVATTWGKTFLFGSSLSSDSFIHIICIHVDVFIALLRYNGYVRLCNLRFMHIIHQSMDSQTVSMPWLLYREGAAISLIVTAFPLYIAGPYGSCIFNFLRNLYMFSIVAVPIYTPTNSLQEFPFVHNLNNTCSLLPFW